MVDLLVCSLLRFDVLQVFAALQLQSIASIRISLQFQFSRPTGQEALATCQLICWSADALIRVEATAGSSSLPPR